MNTENLSRFLQADPLRKIYGFVILQQNLLIGAYIYKYIPLRIYSRSDVHRNILFDKSFSSTPKQKPKMLLP